jgi:Spy/CpxP family protein refolding chaperone
MNKLVNALLVIVSLCAIVTSLYSACALRHAMRHGDMGPMSHGMQAWGGKGGFGGFREERLQNLHDSLQLTAAQESAWKTFTDKLQPEERPAMPDRSEITGKSVPERLDMALSMVKQREGAFESRVAAIKQFYATLTPQQQTVFNEQFMPAHGGHHGSEFHRH